MLVIVQPSASPRRQSWNCAAGVRRESSSQIKDVTAAASNAQKTPLVHANEVGGDAPNTIRRAIDSSSAEASAAKPIITRAVGIKNLEDDCRAGG